MENNNERNEEIYVVDGIVFQSREEALEYKESQREG
jgi:hypothetical protein